MTWTGAPAGQLQRRHGTPAANPGLHVTVVNTSNDVGVAAAYARTLTYYAAQENGYDPGHSGQEHRQGPARPDDPAQGERRDQGHRRCRRPATTTTGSTTCGTPSTQTGLYIPSSFTGTMPSGAPINSSSTFMSIRPFYATDPAWAAVQAYMNGGPAPTFQYHRFWAQADIAMAFADYGSLFPAG